MKGVISKGNKTPSGPVYFYNASIIRPDVNLFVFLG